MSTHSITVSGPSTRLATLRALALKVLSHTHNLIGRLRLAISTGGRMVSTAAASALAIVASDTGYDLVRNSVATAADLLGSLIASAARWAASFSTCLGRLALRPVRAWKPELADACQRRVTAWLGAPISRLTSAAMTWLRHGRQILAELTNTSLARTATVKAAQVAGVILGIHALTEGAVAAKLVAAAPWTMTAVVWATQPVTAALVVASTFAIAIVLAATWLRASSPDPTPGQGTNSCRDVGEAPELLAGPRPSTNRLDLEAVAAALQVEVTSDGSVLVLGIPEELSDDVALAVAHTAADAATRRLERILIRRRTPNRDDRRLLTKVAREAVRRSMPSVA